LSIAPSPRSKRGAARRTRIHREIKVASFNGSRPTAHGCRVEGNVKGGGGGRDDFGPLESIQQLSSKVRELWKTPRWLISDTAESVNGTNTGNAPLNVCYSFAITPLGIYIVNLQ